MSWTNVRWAITGMAIGLLVALAPSCGKKCGPDNCASGCCTTKNECLSGSDAAACGTAGATCGACASTETCTGNKCVTIEMGDGGVDAGYVDAGQPCVKDDDCAGWKDGTRCDQSTNQCIPGSGCNVESDCQSQDPNDICYVFGIQCRCVQETGAPQGYSGVCRRRLAPCEECTNDSQCGSNPVFDPLGVCKALQGDSSGKKYCFQQKVGSCPCGTVDDGFGYCKPQNNNCSSVGCVEDKACPSGSVCNTGKCLCEPRCRWDFTKKELAAPGCPPGTTCWIDNANLSPTSLYYGAGRCRPPCSSAAECAQSATNAYGGPLLTCRGEQLNGGGVSDKRCRANGDCMDNAECPEQPPEAIPLGYCDRGSFTCKTDCRTGSDPVTGQAFKDCRAPYACAAGTGGADAGNYCRLLTCVEQGGAAIACTRGEYCCGEDKDNDGGADPCPPQNERGPDNCYSAPKPPFCTTCMSNDDCKNVQLPSYLSGAGACTNGSKSPSCSKLPMLCINVGPRPGTMMPDVSVCAPSTYNDGTRDSFGVGRDVKGCPAGFPAVIIRPQIAMGGSDYCSSDVDCNQGTDAGRCGADQTITQQDGGHPKVCLCTAGSSSSQCPNNDAGLTSECKFGISGQTVPCVQSVVCLPNASILFKDAGPPAYGCGI